MNQSYIFELNRNSKIEHASTVIKRVLNKLVGNATGGLNKDGNGLQDDSPLCLRCADLQEIKTLQKVLSQEVFSNKAKAKQPAVIGSARLQNSRPAETQMPPVPLQPSEESSQFQIGKITKTVKKGDHKQEGSQRYATQPDEFNSNDSETSLELSEYLSQISLEDLLEADFIDKGGDQVVRKSSIQAKGQDNQTKHSAMKRASRISRVQDDKISSQIGNKGPTDQFSKTSKLSIGKKQSSARPAINIMSME